MNIFRKVLVATRCFRLRYGHWVGSLIWLSLMKEKFLPYSAIFWVRVPGCKSRIFLRAHTSDVEVFCQIFIRGELDVQMVIPPRYIIDGGANIGLASIYFANRFPGVVIDAIEISEINVDVLKMNVGAYANIRVLRRALWGKAATLKISNPTADPWAFRVEETSEEDAQGIPAVCIGEMLAERRLSTVDLLKIDIEGAEIELFAAGADEWIPSVKCIMVELHDYMRKGCERAVTEALSRVPHSRGKCGEYHVFCLSSQSAVEGGLESGNSDNGPSRFADESCRASSREHPTHATELNLTGGD